MQPFFQDTVQRSPSLDTRPALSTFGVVIPAQNGAKTIGRVLAALAAQSAECALHVVVVVNGARDDTRPVAERYACDIRSRGHVCEVLSSPPGRANAIRVGEARLPPGNRLYVDCDASLSDNAVAELDRVLMRGSGIHFAVPRLVLGPSPSHATRAYFRAWRCLPYVRNSPVTYGVYAVSAEGRRRWSELPLIHSDDKFVRLHFAVAERRVVFNATYEVVPPHGLGQLIRTRRRYLAGNRELAGAYPELVRGDLCRRTGSLRALMSVPWEWPSTAVFVLVYALAVISQARPR